MIGRFITEKVNVKTVKQLQQIDPISINYSRIQPGSRRSAQFALDGELGFRLARAAHRIENELPYSHEYLLSQISGARDEWSNFPRVHADIAGRWVLAETYLHAGQSEPPQHLAAVIEDLLKLQNDDGSFGIVSFDDEPLNMHKAYGNGWMLKALAQYAITFADKRVCHAAVQLGEFYKRTFPLWDQSNRRERDTKFYAISISCYYHAFDGLVSLYQLTDDDRWLELVEKFIPNLAPLEEADHSHMYLTIRRGLLRYYQIKGMDDAIEELAQELHRCYESCMLETGGVPERFWLPDGEHADDEGCSLFDWEILTTQMFEATGDTRWLDYAIFNLENQIFYNQTYNGGFGSCELGHQYKQQGKEAPWCCSVFGPYGLIESGASFVHFKEEVLLINHLISGTFKSEAGDSVTLSRDEETGRFTIDLSDAPGIQLVNVYQPHWVDFSTEYGDQVDQWFVITAAEQRTIAVPFQYRVWLSNAGKAPKRITAVPADRPFLLFYGPWLLTHRFHEQPVNVDLELDQHGYVTNFRRWFMRGVNFYGESTRLVIPSDRTVEQTDTFRGVYEEDGDLYMYPLKDKESPNQGQAIVYSRRR